MAASTGEPASERTKRINCRNCGFRIRSDAEICPHCHVNPQTRRPLPSNLLIAVLVGLVLFVFGCVLAAQFLIDPLTQFVGSGLKLQPTTVIQIVYAVATQASPTATNAPTFTPLPTLTPTSRFSPTPTRRGAPTITPTQLPPPPTSSNYGAPKLTAPVNNTSFFGEDADIFLEWQGVVPGGLRENEWYLVTISYTARNGTGTTQSGWSRETRWSVKKDWWSEASLAERTFSWNVQLMRVDGADPFTSPTRIPATPASETRKFVWQ